MVELYEIILIAGFIAIGIYAGWCYIQDLKDMKTGEDKRRIENIVKKVIPMGEQYTIAYASWCEVVDDTWGRKYSRYYWYYAIGFNDDRIYIIPLEYDKKDINYDQYYCIEKNQIAWVESVIWDNTRDSKLRLFDESGKEIVHLHVEPKNYSYHSDMGVNLRQEEECAAFRELIIKWKKEINGGY